MSKMKWTDNQYNAINARGGSVLVSAAAGSGKTAVLVQRVIETITDTLNPTARVEKAINKLLKEDPDNEILLKQKQRLYNAKINTIDGFCVDFVRQYFYKLDIQKDFRIADEKELKILTNKALDNTLEYFYNDNSQGFVDLISSVCTYRDDNRLRENILNLYKFLVTIPFMNTWMKNKLDVYNILKTPVKSSPYVLFIMYYIFIFRT